MKTVEKIGDWVFRHRGFIPVPFVVFALIGLVFYKPEFFYEHNTLRYTFYILGLISILKGELLRVWANGHAGFVLHSRSRTIRAKSLVTTGPYGLIRNPLYAGNFLIGFGFCLLTLTWWIIILYIVFFTLEYGLIILAEERFLREKFPEEFENYYNSVPKIIPRLSNLKKIDLGDFRFEYLYPERWTLINIIIAGIAIILLNYLREIIKH